MYKIVSETPEEDLDSFVLAGVDICIVASALDAEIVDLVCGRGEYKEASDEDLEIATTTQMQNIL